MIYLLFSMGNSRLVWRLRYWLRLCEIWISFKAWLGGWNMKLLNELEYNKDDCFEDHEGFGLIWKSNGTGWWKMIF